MKNHITKVAKKIKNLNFKSLFLGSNNKIIVGLLYQYKQFLYIITQNRNFIGYIICNLLAVDFTFKIVLVDFFVRPDICELTFYFNGRLL